MIRVRHLLTHTSEGTPGEVFRYSGNRFAKLDKVLSGVTGMTFAELPQIRLRLAIAGLKILPWGAMPLVRHLTAFRLHSPHTHRTEVRQFIARTVHATREGYLDRLTLLKQFDVRDRLRDIQCPVLFLAAENDHLVPSVEQARYMAERVPGSVMRLLEGHGHICLIAPDIDLGAILDRWLGTPSSP